MTHQATLNLCVTLLKDKSLYYSKSVGVVVLDYFFPLIMWYFFSPLYLKMIQTLENSIS